MKEQEKRKKLVNVISNVIKEEDIDKKCKNRLNREIIGESRLFAID